MTRGLGRIQWGTLLLGAIVGMLLLGALPVVAAIGDPVLQGHFNSVGRRTTLAGSAVNDAMFRVVNRAANGTGIEIKVEPKRPPFVVNTSARVKNLNADRVDGKHLGALMLKAKYDSDRDLVVDDAEKLDGLNSTAFVKKDGAWSCPGSAFDPVSSDTDYATSAAALRYRTTGNGSSAFRCALAVPQGVMLTSVTFAVQDSLQEPNISCSLRRTNLSTGILIDGPLTSDLKTVFAPGRTQLTTDAISNPRTDNASFAYYVQCSLPVSNAEVGIYGATVSYEAPPELSVP